MKRRQIYSSNSVRCGKQGEKRKYQEEVGREMICTQGNRVKANHKKIIREKNWGPGEWWERKEQRGGSWGVQCVLHFHFSPRDSLVFVSGCLGINRPWSVCLTGGSLGFDAGH